MKIDIGFDSDEYSGRALLKRESLRVINCENNFQTLFNECMHFFDQIIRVIGRVESFCRKRHVCVKCVTTHIPSVNTRCSQKRALFLSIRNASRSIQNR